MCTSNGNILPKQIIINDVKITINFAAEKNIVAENSVGQLLLEQAPSKGCSQ